MNTNHYWLYHLCLFSSYTCIYIYYHQPSARHNAHLYLFTLIFSTYSFSFSLTVSKLSNNPLKTQHENKVTSMFQALTGITLFPVELSEVLTYASPCKLLCIEYMVISQLRSIFCDSSTWFNIKLDTTSPVPSSNINVILPPFSNLLSISTASMPRAKQHVRWQQGAGIPVISTSS